MELFLRNKKLIENNNLNSNNRITEVKKACKKQFKEQVAVEGKTGAGIAKLFSDIYKELFNWYYDSNMSTKSKIEDAIKADEYRGVCKVTPDLIHDALKKLKPGKSDTAMVIGSDILKFLSKLLMKMLSFM